MKITSKELYDKLLAEENGETPCWSCWSTVSCNCGDIKTEEEWIHN